MSNPYPQIAGSPIFQTQRLDKTKASFIDLPYELREKIYANALCTNLWISPETEKTRRRNRIKDHGHMPTRCCGRMPRIWVFPNARLLRVCRMIEYEASPFLYGNTFIFGFPVCPTLSLCNWTILDFTNFESIIPFLEGIQTKNRRHLTHLVFSFISVDFENRCFAQAIGLLNDACKLRTLEFRTYSGAAVEKLFSDAESDLMREAAKLRGIERFIAMPWPETLQGYEVYRRQALQHQAINWWSLFDGSQKAHRAVFQRYLNLKEVVMQPRQRLQVGPSQPAKRPREDGEDGGQAFGWHVTKRGK